MTVILGLNLSDRVYLLADSRVSYKDSKSGQTIVKHDNMLKIEPLESLKSCVIASAGDARFAKFIIKKLNSDFQNKDINYLRDNIVSWAQEKAHEYFQNYNTVANFLIAGVDTTSKKKINKSKFMTIFRAYTGGGSGTASVKSIITRAMKEAKADESYLELQANNTVLFSLKINENGVEVSDSEWGDVLLMGPKEVTNEDISASDIGRFEFEYSQDKVLEQDSLLLTAILGYFISNKNLPSVGGSLIPVALTHDEKLATLPRRIFSSNPDGSDVQFISAHLIENGRFYRVDENGANHRLHRVSEFKYDRVSKSLLSIID